MITHRGLVNHMAAPAPFLGVKAASVSSPWPAPIIILQASVHTDFSCRTLLITAHHCPSLPTRRLLPACCCCCWRQAPRKCAGLHQLHIASALASPNGCPVRPPEL